MFSRGLGALAQDAHVPRFGQRPGDPVALEAVGVVDVGGQAIGAHADPPVLRRDGRGASIDARFRALDAKTGKELWVMKLADAAKATPITFQGKDGKQYVAVLAGGGEMRPPDNPGGRLYVFALP